MFVISQQRSAEGVPGMAGVDYSLILDALPDAVFIHDGETGRILEVNQACLDMFGYPPAALVGLEVEALSSSQDGFGRAEAAERIQEALATGRSEFLWRSKRADGSLFWSEVRLMGTRQRVIAIVRDITASTRTGEALKWAEAKFETVFHASPVSIMLARFPDGVVEEANDTLLRLTGYQRGELIGRSAKELWVDNAVRDRYLTDLVARRAVVGMECQFRLKDGTLKLGRLAGRLIDLADGPRILTLIEDITAWKENEHALLRISRLYAALSMVNQALIRVRTPEELYTNICRALVEGGGFWAAWVAAPDPETLRFLPLGVYGAGEKWVENLPVYNDPDRPEGRGTMGRAFREGRPVIANDFDADPRTAPWRDRAGAQEFKAAAALPLRRGDGAVFGVLCIYAKEAGYFGEQEIALLNGVCSDLTFALEGLDQERQRRALELRLQQTQKLESLGNLAGGVAHDMNNVLGAILGLSSIELERAMGDATARRSMETIVKACVRGREVVQSLLCFARRELGDLQTVDLNQLVHEIIGLLSHTTLARIRFVTELDPALRCVEGDPGTLNHAFMNICVNALDAMPEGGTLTVRTRNGAGGAVEVAFEDSGEGMPEEVVQRALEPFFTTKPAGKGTGLGLAMVYGTVQAHKGSLALASQPGVGTLVRLSFPGTEARPAAPAVPADCIPRPGLRILLVDDDDLLRESVLDVLLWQGHQPEGVGGGREALDLLAGGASFDLIILDLNMPGMTGAEALPRILALRPEQKILVSSGYTDAGGKGLLEGRPNVRMLGKPFTTQELARKIAELGA